MVSGDLDDFRINPARRVNLSRDGRTNNWILRNVLAPVIRSARTVRRILRSPYSRTDTHSRLFDDISSMVEFGSVSVGSVAYSRFGV